jgi:hypothetical protein
MQVKKKVMTCVLGVVSCEESVDSGNTISFICQEFIEKEVLPDQLSPTYTPSAIHKIPLFFYHVH